MNKNYWQLLEFAGRKVLSEGRFVRKFIEIVTKKSLSIRIIVSESNLGVQNSVAGTCGGEGHVPPPSAFEIKFWAICWKRHSVTPLPLPPISFFCEMANMKVIFTTHLRIFFNFSSFSFFRNRLGGNFLEKELCNTPPPHVSYRPFRTLK